MFELDDGERESSGGFLLGRDFDSVMECYALDDYWQLILTLQSSPAFRRSHHELEHHDARRIL